MLIKHGLIGGLRKTSFEISSVKYSHDTLYILNSFQYELFEKIIMTVMRSGPSSMVLIFRIYETQFTRRQPFSVITFVGGEEKVSSRLKSIVMQII